MIKLFDLHCDTPRFLLDKNESLISSRGHISLDKAKAFSPYIQVAAVWSTFDDPKKAKSVFDQTVNRFNEECKNAGCDLIKSSEDMLASVSAQEQKKSKAGFIYCIEDCGFITNTDILDDVYEKGVRVLIPMWAKTNPLGAAHDAEGRLSELGREILSAAAKKGMILDISHASFRSASEIMDIAERHHSPVIASHSNSRTFFDHTRNLYTDQVKRLISLGGIIGHSLCPWHLAKNGDADIDSVLDNIEHLINEAGEDNICFGCDLDGTDLPKGFSDITSLEELYNKLSKRFSPQIAEKITYLNALNKFQQFLK